MQSAPLETEADESAADAPGFGPPRGMRDFYPDDMAVRNALFDTWRRAAALYGFAQYDACVVESLDLLKRKAGEEIVDQIYTFTDKSGRDLALRPEMTPTLARMVAARQGGLELPLKWFAIAQCFRYERMSRGRKREHYQWNLDIVGEKAVTAEAEVIATALAALRLLGLGPADVAVHVSSRALLADLLLALGMEREHHPATFLALDKRGKIGDAAMADLLRAGGLTPGLVDKVFALLAIRSLDDAMRTLGASTSASDELQGFFAALEPYGCAELVRFDVSIVRGLAYYTGIVFEAFDGARKFRAIFGGGRYDNLLATVGGAPQTAVGLGFGDVVIAELLADLGRLPKPQSAAGTAIGYMDQAQRTSAARVAARLRAGGETVDLALRPEKPKSLFGRASRRGFQRAIYVGPDDVTAGAVRVKDLATRQETPMPIEG